MVLLSPLALSLFCSVLFWIFFFSTQFVSQLFPIVLQSEDGTHLKRRQIPLLDVRGDADPITANTWQKQRIHRSSKVTYYTLSNLTYVTINIQYDIWKPMVSYHWHTANAHFGLQCLSLWQQLLFPRMKMGQFGQKSQQDLSSPQTQKSNPDHWLQMWKRKMKAMQPESRQIVCRVWTR